MTITASDAQKLLETTFRLDISVARKYGEADDRWVEVVRFLDLDDDAGWQLFRAMLNPDYRQRPTVEAVSSHRFLTRSCNKIIVPLPSLIPGLLARPSHPL